MNVLITGGTGFVGQHLSESLRKKGHHIYVLTRSPQNYDDNDNITYIHYDTNLDALPNMNAVINLAGDSLFGYWSKRKKDAIVTSRLETTKKVIRMMERMKEKPAVFISGSAIGFYGTSDNTIFTEDTVEPGNDFLAETVTSWERAAKQAEDLGIRTVYARFGVILGKKGALPYMSLPVKLFAGGPIGTGDQWISWIHIEDAIQLLLLCLFNDNIKGPINLTAPNPKRNKDFIKILATSLNRPYWLRTPAPLLRLTIGEMSGIITKGQYVLPRVAEQYNHPFLYPDLREALDNIHSK